MKKLSLIIALAITLNATNAYDNLFIKYGNEYNIPAVLLKAIAKAESGLNPNIISKPNKNGSKDYGLMQINSIHLNKNGLTEENILDPETNIKTGAKILRYCMNKHNELTWQSLNCYNGKVSNNSYNLKVLKNIEKNQILVQPTKTAQLVKITTDKSKLIKQ